MKTRILTLACLLLIAACTRRDDVVMVPVSACKSYYTGRTSVTQDAQCIPTMNGQQMNACGITTYTDRTIQEVQTVCSYTTWQ